MADPAHMDLLARRIFEQAIAEHRSGELLDALFNGASATVDAVSGRLVIFSAEVLAQAAGEPDEDDTLCDCGDRLSAKQGAKCGNCQAAAEPMPLAYAVFDHRTRRTPRDPEYVVLHVEQGQERLHIDGEYAVYRRTDRPTS